MKFNWAAIFERVEVTQTADGEIENCLRIKKAGSLSEEQSGQNVTKAILESTWNVGNLVWLEISKVE